MKHYFILLISYITLLNTHPSCIAKLECHSPTPIYNTVNVITGEYCEANCDISLHGPFPLQLHRAFSNNTLGHWQFNHPNIFQNNPAMSDGVLLPNSLALYEYDKYQRLSAINHTSLNGQTQFHKITLEYNLSTTSPRCIINATNNSPITYYYKSASIIPNMPPYIIDKIVDADQFSTQYQYENNFNNKHKLVTSKKEPNNRYINTSYDSQGRVVCQWAPLGSDATPIIKHKFTYRDDHTIVEDALNQKVIYRHHKDHLTAIEYYEQDQIIRSEIFSWEITDKNPPRIISKAIKDEKGTIISCKTFAYDLQGHIVRETLHGNLTGINDANIQLDSKGIPIHNGVESYTIHFQYDTQFPYNLLSKSEDNGNTTHYHYVPNTQLVSAKFIESKFIRIRHFYIYDQNLLLNKTIIDDGTSTESMNLTHVTQRHITYHSYSFDSVTQKYFETLDEKGLDLSTGEEKQIKRTLNHYSDQGKLLEQKVYNNSEEPYLTRSNSYDVCGKQISSYDEHNTHIQYIYDDNRNLIETITTNKKGENETSLQSYDFANRVTRIEKKNAKHPSLISTFSYDYAGQLIRETDTSGNEINHQYDIFGNRTQTVYPQVLDLDDKPYHPIIIKKYNVIGNLISSTDANGKTTQMSYNARGNPIHIIFSDGSHEQFEYALDGSLIKTVKRDYTTQLYEYDYAARISKTVELNRSGEIFQTSTIEYNAFHPIVKEENGIITEYQYDHAGRTIATIERQGNKLKQTKFIYDVQGYLISEQYFFGSDKNHYFLKKFRRDFLGKILETTIEDAQGNILKQELSPELDLDEPEKRNDIDYNYHHTTTYGHKVLQTISINTCGFSTVTNLDSLGRVEAIKKLDPLGKLITQQEMRYDANGNKLCEIHYAFQDNQITKTFTLLWEYDSNNRPIKTTEAAGSLGQNTTYYTYASNGKISSITKSDGTILSYEYDESNRLKAFYGSDQNFHYIYGYDAHHRLISIEDLIQNTLTTRKYNEQGELLSEKLGNDLQINYERDFLNRITTMILPDNSKVTYEYNGPLLKAIHRENANGDQKYSYNNMLYDLSGQLVQTQMIENLGNVTFQYDEEHRIINQSCPQFSQSLQYDDRNNINEITTDDSWGNTIQKYTYDAREQLSTDGDSHYTYDTFFNRTSKNEFAYINNENNQLIQAGNIHYVYNASQCLAKKSWTDSDQLSHEINYSYDALNRLTKVQTDKMSLSYLYDAFGRCLSKTREENNKTEIIHYLYDGSKEVGALTDNHQFLEFRVLNPLVTAERNATVAIELKAQLYAPIHDLQGSIALLIDAKTGETVENYRYTAFGEISKKIQNDYICPWLFSGKRFDADTGLVGFGQRNYDPSIGRWITPDPLKHIDSLNTYAYLLNNPLGSYDMWGHFSVSDIWENFVKEVKHVIDTIVSLKSFSTERNFKQEITATIEPLFGKMFLLMHGFYKEDEYVGVYGKGEIHDKLRITAVNGLLNLNEYWIENVKTISLSHGNTNVHYISDPTGGWTGDVIKGLLAKCGYASSATKLLAHTWKSLIQDMGGVNGGGMILHYAHSIGGTNTAIARDLLSPEEQKMIKVITIGSATIIPEGGFGSVINYISKNDFIGIMDPYSYFSSFFKQSNVVHLDSINGIPLLDHLLTTHTYARLLEMLGREFMENNGLTSL